MVLKTTLVALLVAVTPLTGACGRNTTATPGAPPTTAATDPAVTAAAEAVHPVLRDSFADTFAGLELRHEVPMLVVHRRPDPRLDAEVSRLAPGVRVEFHDAQHTLSEMSAAGARVMDDRGHWASRGATLVSVAPAVDGSGVQVVTSTEPGDLAGELRERYPAMSFDVRRGGEVVFPVHTGPVPILPGPPPPATE